ncbi:MAG: sigma-54-dependent Fis family transcriptional regulator [Sedimentisphaerales bacterium]|nr:sigma-54-dependent Fis family transcriptional regulator [Sedimentisphaerales bacterium]
MINAFGNDEDRVQQRHDAVSVLIVEHEPATARFMLEIFARRGISAQWAPHKKAALDALDRNRFNLTFISTQLGTAQDDSNGFELLGAIRAQAPEMPVVMVAGHPYTTGGIDSPNASQVHDGSLLHIGTQAAVRAMQAGCRDFLLKPLKRQTLEGLLETLLPNRQVATVASAREGDRDLYQIVGKSPKLVQTVTLAEKIAPTSVPVLISGESGTGKELISLLIHHHSKRAMGPFVHVNCAALSDTLLESELFGHEKGAFTGAYTQRKGRFEMAHGGTLLLDEITETPAKFQAKLLRILEQQEFERVGGNENIKVNVRVISTSNRDLLGEVQAGRFRADLYYRLSTARVVVPSLRERREDLPELVWHFVNLYAREAQRRIARLDPDMMNIFAEYPWPGNIRQLRNVVLTSLILGVGSTLSLADVSWLFDELQPLPQQASNQPPAITAGVTSEPAQDQPSGVGGIPLADLERHAIIETLRQTSGNQTKAAKVLGISDRTLREKMRRYRKQETLEPVS